MQHNFLIYKNIMYNNVDQKREIVN